VKDLLAILGHELGLLTDGELAEEPDFPAPEFARKYSPDQDRDENGRFATMGGGSLPREDAVLDRVLSESRFTTREAAHDVRHGPMQRGFIMPDGSVVNVGQDGPAHLDFAQTYLEAAGEVVDSRDDMARFASMTGAIRLLPHGNLSLQVMLAFYGPPTAAQEHAIQMLNTSVLYDIFDSTGHFVGMGDADAADLDRVFTDVARRWRAARKYDPDQPRDENGRFATMGGGSGGDTPDDWAHLGGPGWRAAHEVLEKATGLKHVLVVADRPCVRAAPLVADVMGRMRALGYPMPKGVEIVPTSAGFRGATSYATDALGDAGAPDKVTVYVPSTLPADVDLNDAVRVAYTTGTPEYARTAVSSFEDIVVHEMGHVYNGHANTPMQGWGQDLPGSARDLDTAIATVAGTHATDFRALHDIAIQVSEYAYTNQNEFLAETFTRLYRGDTLPADVHTLYATLGGKLPIGYKGTT